MIIQTSHAQSINTLNLPKPGTMVSPSSTFTPVLLEGLTIDPENPLNLEFIVNSGSAYLSDIQIKNESERLIKYFLASMTTPQNDFWVNLSPYEQDRIIPDELGKTELGRDLLAQDYLLKQITATLIYPEKEVGNKFWDKVYKLAHERFGTTDIPVNTFNKVWILPEEANVHEHGRTVYIMESRLKVMLEEDYLALDQNKNNKKLGTNQISNEDMLDSSSVSSQIIREIIIPELEREVNEGQHFAPLRQIYHSLILAQWYKETIKESILNKVYIDQNKIAGVDLNDPTIKNQIYDQYIEAYKKGVFNYIKEDYDQLSQELIPKKYFSGGITGSVKIKRNTAPARSSRRTNAIGRSFILPLVLTAICLGIVGCAGNSTPPYVKNIPYHVELTQEENEKIVELIIEIHTAELERKEAAFAELILFGPAIAKDALPSLASLINQYNSPATVDFAARAIVEIGEVTPEIKDRLNKLLYIGDHDSLLYPIAIRTLGQLRAMDSEFVRDLRFLLDRDEYVTTILNTLVNLGDLAKPAIPALQIAILDKDVNNGVASYRAMEQISPNSGMSQLIAYLEGDNIVQAQRSITLLGELGEEARNTLPLLRQLLTKEDAWTVSYYLKPALEKIDSSYEAKLENIRYQIYSNIQEVREDAFQDLLNLKPYSNEAVRLILHIFRNPDLNISNVPPIFTDLKKGLYIDDFEDSAQALAEFEQFENEIDLFYSNLTLFKKAIEEFIDSISNAYNAKIDEVIGWDNVLNAGVLEAAVQHGIKVTPGIISRRLSQQDTESVLKNLENMSPEYAHRAIDFLIDFTHSKVDIFTPSLTHLIEGVLKVELVNRSVALKLLYQQGDIVLPPSVPYANVNFKPLVWENKDVPGLEKLSQSEFPYYREAATIALEKIRSGDSQVRDPQLNTQSKIRRTLNTLLPFAATLGFGGTLLKSIKSSFAADEAIIPTNQLQTADFSSILNPMADAALNSASFSLMLMAILSLILYWIYSLQFQNSSPAMQTINANSSNVEHGATIDSSPDETRGGIDFNHLDINREGNTNIQFNPDSMQEMLDLPIDGFMPIIIDLVPINNILPLLGLEQQPNNLDIELSNLR